MEFIVLIALIVGWIHFNNVTTALEERLTRLEQGESAKVSTTLLPIPPPAVPGAEPSAVPGAFPQFIDWVKKDFMVKLGAFLLLLAFGWFVSYAFANDWIGPVGRITLGLVAGVALMVLGAKRMQSYRHQGAIFTVLGATIILLTTYAARELYDFFTPASALWLMLVTVALVAFVSLRYRSEPLALTGLLLGSWAPLLTAAPAPDVVGLFSYLLVIVGGTLWVVWFTGWTRLTLASLVVTYLYSLQFIEGTITDRDAAILFSFLFVAIFFAANVVSLVRRRMQETHLTVHTLTALCTAIFLFSWIEAAAVDVWRSLLYSAWAVVFAFGSYIVHLTTRNHRVFYLYGATSAALIGMATAAELDGPVLTVAYFAEIMLVLTASVALRSSVRSLAYISMLLIVPVLRSLESLGSWNWDGVWHMHFAVLFLAMLSLCQTARVLRVSADVAAAKMTQVMITLLTIGSGFYAMSIVWLVSHEWFLSDTATMISLVLYTVAGIGFYVQGVTKNMRQSRIAGSVLIALVVARLLLIEVWDMALEGRIITFLIIGGILISTAFMRRLIPDQNTDQTNHSA